MRIIFIVILGSILCANSFGQIFHENFEIADSVSYSSGFGNSWASNTRLHVSGLACDSATIQNTGDVLKMTTIPFSTSGYNSVFLYFNHICKIEFFDNAFLEVSVDNGLSWVTLLDDAGGPLSNCFYLSHGLYRTQGSRFQEASYIEWQPGTSSVPDSSWWKREVFDLTPILANTPNAMLRFVLLDGNNSGGAGRSGWYIDDIMISNVLDFNTLPVSNLILGKAYVDYNANQVMDGTDLPVVSQHVSAYFIPGSTFQSDSNGNFSMYVQRTGTVYLWPVNYGAPFSYYSVMPAVDSAIFTGWGQTDSLHDFAFQPNGVYDDLAVYLPFFSGNIRPGMPGTLALHYRNQGTTVQNPTLVMYPDSALTYTGTIGTQPSLVTSDSIVWNLTNMLPLSRNTIYVRFVADSALTMGTVLRSYAIIYPVSGDNYPSNNQDSTLTLVTNSWDPNDIKVNPEIIYTPNLANDPVIEYTIRFQNTGNDTAFYVRIDQSIPPELDMNTYELIASSHDVYLHYDGQMRYVFNNILLPDSLTNPLESQGFITFRIRPVAGLIAGDTIRSYAAIYFDINPPVITNTAITAIVDPLSTPEWPMEEAALQVFPNPVSDKLNLKMNSSFLETSHVEIINMFGQVVEQINTVQPKIINQVMQLEITHIPSGIYIVVVHDSNAIRTARFMKISH